MTITLARFNKYQGIFHQHVEGSDMILEVGINAAVAPSGDFLTDFTGSNTRTPTVWYPFHALYDTNIDPYTRDRTGLSQTESGAIYLSPLQLIPVFGTFILDRKKTVFRKSGHLFLPESIKYLEPLYGSCIAVEINLKEAIQG